MKKTLIALAAVAVSSAAMAQVTLYGVMDMGLQDVTGVDSQLNSSATMNNGSSRWGIRGSEDLGGGMKAGFNFEQGISLDNGAATVANARAAFVTLSGGFGEISMGRRLNAAFNTAATWELTGAANYSAVVSQFGDAINGLRYDNMIMYTAPTMAGVTVQVAHVMKGDRTSGEATNDVSIRYANGPLRVAANWNKNSEDAKASKHVGASYDFGVAKVAAAYIDPDTDAKGYSIGATVPMGKISLTADFVRDTNAKDTDYVLEAKYSFSKNTTAYIAHLNDGKKKAGGLGADKTGTSIGLRHNF